MLDTEELKQLLQKSSEFTKEIEMLSEDDKNMLTELYKEPLDSAGKAITKILQKNAEIGDIAADIVKPSLLTETLGEDYLFIDANYREEATTFAFDKSTVKKVAGILLETMPEEGEITETERNSFDEVFSQMISRMGISLSNVLGGTVEFTESKEESTLIQREENMIQMSFSLKINDDVNTTVYYFLPYTLINRFFAALKKSIGTVESEKTVSAEKSVKEKNVVETVEELEETTATIQPIRFEELTEDLVANEKENMSLLMDLQLQVSVELGKVKKPIKDILQFTQGTIVELDRLAGDNVDVLVSGKIIAKGEVVVVDQNFGVRITKIVIPEKRV
ncbi:MAG: flagellar motor switch protein FliN [Clostridia bacterium]|nr:flagellar motor switch protein FliN [Clostridia bacterium]